MTDRTLTRVVAVEGDEMSLAALAEALEDRIDQACADIEEDGGTITGPVSVAPARSRYTDVPEGTDREYTTVEQGLVAVITYRIPRRTPDAE